MKALQYAPWEGMQDGLEPSPLLKWPHQFAGHRYLGAGGGVPGGFGGFGGVGAGSAAGAAAGAVEGAAFGAGEGGNAGAAAAGVPGAAGIGGVGEYLYQGQPGEPSPPDAPPHVPTASFALLPSVAEQPAPTATPYQPVNAPQSQLRIETRDDLFRAQLPNAAPFPRLTIQPIGPSSPPALAPQGGPTSSQVNPLRAQPFQPDSIIPVTPYQPTEPAPIFTPEQRDSCTTCGPIRAQIEEVKQELDVEQQQRTQQQRQETEQKIQDLRTKEGQPQTVQQLDDSIKQKLELLDQLNQELQNQRSTTIPPGSPTQPGPPAPIVGQPPGQPGQPAQPPPPPPPARPVRICMVCQSTEDAVRYQAGEPAACAVEGVTEV